jgi:hypothetical protein
MGPSRYLRQRVGLNPTVISIFHFFRKNLTPGRIDPLTDYAKWLIKSYSKVSIFRTD